MLPGRSEPERSSLSRLDPLVGSGSAQGLFCAAHFTCRSAGGSATLCRDARDVSRCRLDDAGRPPRLGRTGRCAIFYRQPRRGTGCLQAMRVDDRSESRRRRGRLESDSQRRTGNVLPGARDAGRAGVVRR